MSSNNVRALMKERALARRISHPAAKYDYQGRLTCVVCAMVVKHEQLWSSHVTSKSHRTNVAKSQAAQAASRKREASETAVEDAEDGEQPAAGSKRQRVEAGEGVSRQEEVRQGSEEQPVASTSSATDGAATSSFLPSDFFSDPSKAPPPARTPSPGAEAQEGGAAGQAAAEEDDDPEWAAFTKMLEESTPPPPIGQSATAYAANATISSAPVMFDADGEVDEAAAAEDEEEEDDDEPRETEEERRIREEREENMQRIEECVSYPWFSCLRSRADDRRCLNREEREQQEADSRVEALKRRLEAIREARLKKTKKA
jgi:zinc finger protein 830